MRTIELNKTRCNNPIAKGFEPNDIDFQWCPFLAAAKEGIPAGFVCILRPDRKRHASSYNIKRLTACR